MVARAANNNMAAAALLLVTIACHVLVTSACVPLDCVYKKDNSKKLDDPWIIFAIALACLFFLIILLILLWICCFCCYRNDESRAPAIIRRVVLVKRRREKQIVVRKKPKCLHVVAPPVECQPLPPPPDEKLIVISPPPPQPTSLQLTVTDGCHGAAAGPSASTLLERPLKFTITPNYAPQPTVTRDCHSHAAPACKCPHGKLCKHGVVPHFM